MQESTNKNRVRDYFSTLEWLVYALIIVAGIALRWAELDVRPYHHDESQHAMFGKYFYDFPDIQFYKYDPMMHAPLLYNFLRLVYTALGNTLWSARVPIAMLGTLFLFAPLLFRKYFSSSALLILTAAISLSSSMVYWSRFVIHDYFVIFAMLVTLYGVIAARSEQKSFFVLLGITLQFCIKANVFVTLAMLLGYLVYELVVNYFNQPESVHFKPKFLKFLSNNIILFIIVAPLLTIALHIGIGQLDPGNQLWAAAMRFSQNKLLFIPLNLAVYFLIFCLIFFASDSRNNYFKSTYLNLRNYWPQLLVSLAVSCLVFCYIFSSGFRNNKGILDGLFRTSIPYWLNQHDIERIKGPFLFNFYMFSWYEFAFLAFFIIQLYYFYKNAPKIAKLAGLCTLGLALVLSFVTLMYISPDANGNWGNLEDIGGKNIAELKGLTNKAMTHFVHFFKLKDCLDVIGLILLLIHPLIVTTTHILRGERILAFWGYLFTASFFTYSFLGEKVPWLSVYPLIPGFVYLTLYFDDYFKHKPLVNNKDFPVSTVFKYVSLVMLGLTVFFVLETIFSISAILTSFDVSKFFKFFTKESLGANFKLVWTAVWENLLLLTLGLLLYFLHFTNRWTKVLGTVNLKNLTFLLVSLFCLRGAILTNFVYGGSETEFISQVHTTKEFHELAVRLKKESLTNIRPGAFKILGDGDPVWPLTWYMVGANDFKFIASAEERKDFDIIIQTYDDNPKNVPEGFEKRKITLRGWWVPNYNEMSLRKYLNTAVNHIPWSTSGFTYAWLFINKNKH